MSAGLNTDRVRRSRPRSVLAALAALLVVCVSSAPAAAQDAQRIEILEHDASRYPTIEMLVQVPSGAGQAVLDSSAFGLTEAGIPRPLRATAVQEEIDVVLLVDTSGSMRGAPMQAAIDAAISFVGRIPATARLSVVGFASEPYVVSELTLDRAATVAALSGLQARGETGLWDGLVRAADVLRGSGAAGYVVLLSDGADTVSVSDQAQAVAALQQAGVPLYTVALETPESDFAPLQQATAEAGGQYLPVTDPGSLTGLYDELAERLANRYRLTFEAIGNGPEEVVISVADGASVRTTRDTFTFAPAVSEQATAETGSSYESVLRDGIGDRPGRWSDRPMIMWLGAGAFFVSMLILGVLIARPALKVRLSRVHKPSSGSVAAVSGRLSGMADGVLVGSDRGRRLDRVLDAAGMEIRPGELVVGVIAAAVAGGLFAALIGGVLLALVVMVAVPMIAKVVVMRRLRKRREAFAEQIADTLMILSGAMRAGRGFTQALDLVAEEAPSPTCDEFQRVIIESRVGRDLTVSLEDVADRMDSHDFRWLSEAVEVNRDLGGDLAEVMDNISGVVRARNRIARQVKALSAEGRMTGWLLIALPFVMVGYFQLVNPTFVAELFRGVGLFLTGIGLVLLSIGWVWIRKLVDFEY